MAGYPNSALRTLDSFQERKGAFNLLTRWADRFRTP
jgi:hypothetical protein